MRAAWVAALTLACGCSLIYDASDLQNGDRDGGGPDRDVGPGVDTGPRPDTGPAQDAGPPSDTGALPDSGPTMPSSCRGVRPDPTWYACAAGSCATCALTALMPAPVTSPSFSPASVALTSPAGTMELRIATIDDGAARVHVGSSEMDVLAVGDPISLDAPLLPHRAIAMRRTADDELAMVVLGSPDKTNTGLSVITTPADRSALDALTAGAWTPIGRGAMGPPTTVLGPPAVTGGSRHGCDVPAHFFWRLVAGGQVWLGSLEAARTSPSYFRDWDATPHPMVPVPIAGTAGTMVLLSDARVPIGTVLWDVRGGAGTTIGEMHDVGGGRQVGAAALANGSFVFAWADGAGSVYLRGATCANTCVPEPRVPDDLACSGAVCALDGNRASRNDVVGLFAIEGMPRAGFAMARVTDSGRQVNIALYDDLFVEIHDEIVLSIAGGSAPISGVALDTIAVGTDVFVIGALTFDEPASADLIQVFGLRIGGGC